jgi:hypothetical protein
MASSYRTGRVEEALLASQEVEKLAEDVLSHEEYEHANEIAIMLVSTKPLRKAIAELTELVAPPPKRPLYYAQHELGFLPRWTRDAIRDLGDYIDILVKHLAYQLSKDTRVSKFPMGPSLQLVERWADSLPPRLVEFLKRYNSFLYRPGKHEFKLPGDRHGHRFTSKEVVLTAFITMKLAGMIKETTKCDPEFSCHFDSATQDEIERNQSH